jgi:ABC-type multidrug transport system fused ATPase/permease subunit
MTIVSIVITYVPDTDYNTSSLQVIKDFNLSIKPGQVVAIVGPSGGGKSTTVKLLQRFYDITTGKVCVNTFTILEILN